MYTYLCIYQGRFWGLQQVGFATWDVAFEYIHVLLNLPDKNLVQIQWCISQKKPPLFY